MTTTVTTNTATFLRSRLFRTRVAPAAFVFAAATMLAACGGGSSSDNGSGSGGGGQASSQGGGSTVVSVKNESGGGMMLVDSSGKTVYFSDQEKKAGKIVCTGPCLGFWFPVTTSSTSVQTPQGVTGKLGTTKRSDNGKLQVTYNGAPLYTFKLDSASGDAKGNNFKDTFGSDHFTWHAAGSTAKATTPTSSSSSSSSDNGGYGDY